MRALASALFAGALLASSPVVAGDFDWSGPYVGVIGSYSSNDLDAALLKIDGKSVPGTTQSTSVNGGLFGIQAGYGKQIGQFYIGAETDWQWGDLDRDISNAGGAFHTTYSVDQIGTLRARLGYIVGNFMPYVTGGVAINRSTVGAYIPGADLSASASDWNVGYTIGGGLEYRPWQHFALKVEALHTDFGDSELASANIGGHDVDLVSVSNSGTQVRFSAAYNF
jgi:opacity protein-like surface antigen